MSNELSEQLNRIEKMLTAVLKNENRLWWIGGYVYGRTSNNDPYIILYPAGEKLKEKVCRVYEHDFKKLPAYIDTANVTADTEANPNRTQAEKKGIYHPCQPFQIVIYDGKDTQMGPEKRFGDVLRISRQQAPATAAPPQPIQPTRERQLAAAHNKPPDFQQLAWAAPTVPEFTYAAFMVLKNGFYTEQDQIAKTCEMLTAALGVEWKPDSGKDNRAMLAALKKYRDEREKLEPHEGTAAAHKDAKTAALGEYQRMAMSGSTFP